MKIIYGAYLFVPLLALMSRNKAFIYDTLSRTRVYDISAAQNAKTCVSAGIIRRVLAIVLDFGWLFGWFVLLLISSGLKSKSIREIFSGGAWAAVFILILFIYFMLFECGVWHATPGKKLFGLRIETKNDGHLSFGRSLKRSGAIVLFMFVFTVVSFVLNHFTFQFAVETLMPFVGIASCISLFIPVLFTKNKLAVHDFLSGTRVVFGRSKQ